MFRNIFSQQMNWKKLKSQSCIKLYAGNITRPEYFEGYVGLSISQQNRNHILHDVCTNFPIPDSSVTIFQSEDVFEHVPIESVPNILNEIHRVLIPNKGVFRLSLPDYGCDILKKRSLYNINGDLIFDPGGGGTFSAGAITNGGHLWFPTYEIVKELISKSNFKSSKIQYLHYYDGNTSITNKIDYSMGHILRTPDFDPRVQNPYRALSLVVDIYKLT